jgi:hypothetical protein
VPLAGAAAEEAAAEVAVAVGRLAATPMTAAPGLVAASLVASIESKLEVARGATAAEAAFAAGCPAVVFAAGRRTDASGAAGE